jgi:hypothetical protein
VHYGWEAHNIEAQPYMLQALANVREEVVREYEQGFYRLLQKNGLAPAWGGLNADKDGGIISGK